MNGYKIPLSLLKGDTYLADKYFSERFPTPTLEKTENPNYESSGCGVSMNATETEQSFMITDPSDSSKVLCEMIYSTEGIKFRYSTLDMVNNVIDVGVGSNEKLDILSLNLDQLKKDHAKIFGGPTVLDDECELLNSICYGNRKYVAVARNGNYSYYSIDGNTWTKTIINTNDASTYTVCYGNDKFVTVGYNTSGVGYCAYSTNGINWIDVTISDTNRNWTSICYGNGEFISVSSDGYYASSTDGINWIENILIDADKQWMSICYGNGKYVAISNNTMYFAYSEDGINWVSNTVNNLSTTDYTAKIAYENDKFIITTESNMIAYSTDGINWTVTYDDASVNCVCYGNTKYVCGGSGICEYSYDGILWKILNDINNDTIIYDICNIPGSNKFICVGTCIMLVTLSNSYIGGGISELAVTYNWTNAPEGLSIPETAAYLPGENVTVDTYYTDKSVYIVRSAESPDMMYQFSGWDKSDFNITEDTSINGSWSEIFELPDDPIYIDGKHDHNILKTVHYDLNVPGEIMEDVTATLPDDKMYLSTKSGVNSNIVVEIPDTTPTPSILKMNSYYYSFDGFTSDDVNITSDSQ